MNTVGVTRTRARPVFTERQILEFPRCMTYARKGPVKEIASSAVAICVQMAGRPDLPRVRIGASAWNVDDERRAQACPVERSCDGGDPVLSCHELDVGDEAAGVDSPHRQLAHLLRPAAFLLPDEA